MNMRFLCYVAIILLGAGLMDAGVTQIPRFLVTRKGENVTFTCNPIEGQTWVYWYQQLLEKEIKFLIYFQGINKMDDSGMPKDRFSAKCLQNRRCELSIQPTEPGDSGIFFCASSPGNYNSPLTFGDGTKLVVTDNLERVTPPKVTVFQPSEEEIEKKGKATLVCLATGFYPDLVELRWWVNGQETQVGVSTDPQPSREEPHNNHSKYSLSSRLRVSAPFWRNPKNSFRCQVLFYGISEDETWTSNQNKPVTQNVSDQIWGRADCGVTSESYQQSIQSATLFYKILLGKAWMYGLLVSALVWRAVVKKNYS